MDRRSEELERFKRIDLCEYASTRGFVADRRASSRHSMVMRHPNGDKLIVGKASNGKYYYFNAKGNDAGTICDLVQSLDGGTLGDVRKTLRQYNGSGSAQAPSSLPFSLQPSQHDAARVLSAWMQTRSIGAGHRYLTEFRKIDPKVQLDPIFRDRIRLCDRGNAVFPHFNQSGMCGFELKNGNESGTTFTGFSPGGIKSLACSRPRSDDHTMIVCETSIDMLSLANLEGTDGKRFFSTAGQISPHQAECLRSAASKMPSPHSKIVLAFDNDDGGRALAEKVHEALSATGLPIETKFPISQGDDWNDVLRRRKAEPPQIGFSPS